MFVAFFFFGDTFLYMFQGRMLLSNSICHGLFLCSFGGGGGGLVRGVCFVDIGGILKLSLPNS
jgi:hypothetical protein